MSTAQVSSPGESSRLSVATLLALLVAGLTAFGSIYLSQGMKLKACPLCFYQRTFALSLVAILVVGLAGGLRPQRLALAALPLALGGLGVAAFHVSLEVREILECPKGLLGAGTAPQQSLGMFAIVSLLLLADVVRGLGSGGVGALGLLAALVVTSGVIWASCTSNPPLPDPPSVPYKDPPDICRRPYRGESP
jgi:disulfide bond formation protein DsbB